MTLFDFLRSDRGSDAPAAGGADVAPVLRPQSARSLAGPYAAVELVTGKCLCAAVVAMPPGRMLASEAPALPLAGCTSPSGCRCRYRKFPDRRSGTDRRLAMTGEIDRWYFGKNRRERRSPGRRWDD